MTKRRSRSSLTLRSTPTEPGASRRVRRVAESWGRPITSFAHLSLARARGALPRVDFPSTHLVVSEGGVKSFVSSAALRQGEFPRGWSIQAGLRDATARTRRRATSSSTRQLLLLAFVDRIPHPRTTQLDRLEASWPVDVRRVVPPRSARRSDTSPYRNDTLTCSPASRESHSGFCARQLPAQPRTRVARGAPRGRWRGGRRLPWPSWVLRGYVQYSYTYHDFRASAGSSARTTNSPLLINQLRSLHSTEPVGYLTLTARIRRPSGAR